MVQSLVDMLLMVPYALIQLTGPSSSQVLDAYKVMCDIYKTIAPLNVILSMFANFVFDIATSTLLVWRS